MNFLSRESEEAHLKVGLLRKDVYKLIRHTASTQSLTSVMEISFRPRHSTERIHISERADGSVSLEQLDQPPRIEAFVFVQANHPIAPP